MRNPSRSQPSPRYLELLQMYRELHEEGEKFLGTAPQDTFPGASLGPHVSRIKRLIATTESQNVIDYGCGKGLLYGLRSIAVTGGGTIESIQDYWDVDFVHLYDPAYQPFSARPAGTFHGVVCTDVMEHCPEEDLPWILDELFAYAERFVFMTIASYPAKKRLPNGENAHITVRPSEWWDGLIASVAVRYPHVIWEAQVESFPVGADGTASKLEESIGSARSRV